MKNNAHTVQLKGYADFSFITIWNSYSLKFHYFDSIFLRLIYRKTIMIVGFAIQPSSIVTEKYEGEEDAKQHSTRIKPRIEEISTVQGIFKMLF